MVNIDTVYQRVLAIANKEQRAYITPLEFNLLANQAQITLFEQYFYDRNQTAAMPGNEVEYSDIDNILDEKIGMFTVDGAMVLAGETLPTDLYRLGGVFVRMPVDMWAPYPNAPVEDFRQWEAQYVSSKDWIAIQNFPLLQPTNRRPIYTRSRDTIRVFGANNQMLTTDNTGTSIIFCDYVRQPEKVEWGYDVIGEKALHNGTPGRTIHFQHHPSEETKLVIKILELAGVIIEDPNIVQYANQKETQNIQQEKA